MTVVIFGGAGFIGKHYAEHLANNDDVDEIILADIRALDGYEQFPALRESIEHGKARYVYCDVRDKATFGMLPDSDVDLVANFAAVHREPGHAHQEYFATNILGANNICDYTEFANCESLLFTSSISVYQPTNETKDEDTIPAPVSAYGCSKLAAELIHEKWHVKDPANRRLVIIRPGVVYGPGEGGNMTRMVKALKRNAFAYVGNKTTQKASIYVRELISIFYFYLAELRSGLVLSNAVASKPFTMKEYVETVKKVGGWKRVVPNIPYTPLYLAFYFFGRFLRLSRKFKSASPLTIKKLRINNNIISKRLNHYGYEYVYTLEDSFRNWKETDPKVWG